MALVPKLLQQEKGLASDSRRHFFLCWRPFWSARKGPRNSPPLVLSLKATSS